MKFQVITPVSKEVRLEFSTHVVCWRGKRFLGIIPTSAGTDHRLVAMEMDLCLQLVPQLVMCRSFHVTAQ